MYCRGKCPFDPCNVENKTNHSELETAREHTKCENTVSHALNKTTHAKDRAVSRNRKEAIDPRCQAMKNAIEDFFLRGHSCARGDVIYESEELR